MDVQEGDNEVRVRGVQLGLLSEDVQIVQLDACQSDNERTGVTRRGVSRTYSANVGS